MTWFGKFVVVISTLAALCVAFGIASFVWHRDDERLARPFSGTVMASPVPSLPVPEVPPQAQIAPSNHASNPERRTTEPEPVNAHAQRLAELRKRLDGAKTALAIELEFLKKTIREGGVSAVPEDEHEHVNQLIARKAAIDEELASLEREMTLPKPSPAPGVDPPKDLVPIGTTPNAEDARLTDERARLVRSLRSDEAMLAAQGIEARAKIFCRSQPATPLIGSGTVDELEERYSTLAQRSPSTPEGEAHRQYQLRAGQQLLEAAYQNLAACVQMHSTGWRRLPTDDEIRKDEANLRSFIAEIEQQSPGKK
ncbi:MAG: hypothetical protein WBY44_28790 [Bryobacteraceae bacterium]